MSYLITYDRNSNIIRVRLLDSSSTTGAGLTALTYQSAGLIISTIADVESSPTTYTQAGDTIETIATLGTYAAPTPTKCRFKLVDNTNFPGLYEIQLADARFSVTGATDLIVSILGATNLAQTMIHIPLQRLDLQSATVTAGTVSDKTGYALTQTFPANFADMSIAKTTGLVATAVTDSTIADAVWEEALSGHVNTGTTGKALTDIEAVTDKLDDMIYYDEANGNVWTQLALEYTGYNVWSYPNDRTLDNDLNLDTVAASVAKLDGLLESDGHSGYEFTEAALVNASSADVSDIQAVTDKLDDMLESDGSGKYQYTTVALENAPGGEEEGLLSRTYTVYAIDNRTPVPNIQVWATTDAAGYNRVDALKMTNDLGQVTFRFNLPLGTHVWIWNRSSSIGDEEIV